MSERADCEGDVIVLAGATGRIGAASAYIDEAAIFEAYRRLREHEARAVSETKRTRLARARRPQSVPSVAAEPRYGKRQTFVLA